ncbi:hypothetical protein Tco_0148164 [Tanacetum coccineum]
MLRCVRLFENLPISLWNLGTSKIIVSKVECLEMRKVEDGAVRMDGTFQHSASEIETDNITGGAVTSNSIPFTAVSTSVPVHHNWIRIMTPFLIQGCVVDGGKVMFKEKQSFTLFFRAFMIIIIIIIQRSSKRGEKKEKEKGNKHF